LDYRVLLLNLRGNHAAGKSTVVRKVLNHFQSVPVYGMLGPRVPEAHWCFPKARFDPEGGNPGRVLPTDPKPLFILGPYTTPGTAGCDFVTKKGMGATIALFEKYRERGNVLFESILTSVRFGAPGDWLEKHKEEVIVVILDVPLEECLKSLYARQANSDFSGGEKHIREHQHQFERVQERLKEKGFRLEYVSREEAADKIIKWVS
jgi:hypothetical protein